MKTLWGACSVVTCQNFAVTAMYDNQLTEPFLIDLRIIKSCSIAILKPRTSTLSLKSNTMENSEISINNIIIVCVAFGWNICRLHWLSEHCCMIVQSCGQYLDVLGLKTSVKMKWKNCQIVIYTTLDSVLLSHTAISNSSLRKNC